MSEIFGRMGGPRDEAPADDNVRRSLGVDAQGARWLRRHLAGAVVAVTTLADGKFRASTVTACLVASIDPLLFLVSIELDSQMDSWLKSSGFFAASILPWTEQFLADRFAGLAPLASPSFAGIDHFTAVTGAPIITRSTDWADCRIVEQVETGDHTLFIGSALAVGPGQDEEADPLIYYLNRYRRLH